MSREFKKSFNKFAKVIQEDDNFGELLCHRTASPVLQVLLIVSSKISKKKFQSLNQVIVDRARIMVNNENTDEEEDEETIHRYCIVLFLSSR